MKLPSNWPLIELTPERPCLRNPIPEIAEAAKYLDDAVSAHISNQPERAAELIAQANRPAIRSAIDEWAESLWGKSSPYNKHRVVTGAPPSFEKTQREKLRMPSSAVKKLLHSRDGYHCRFCGIPVIRKDIRNRIIALYPHQAPWGITNAGKHAALHVMAAQYDHVLPHSRGGNNDLGNIVVTCAPCNYGRGHHTLEEMGLTDPRTREPIRSMWDGLDRLLRPKG